MYAFRKLLSNPILEQELSILQIMTWIRSLNIDPYVQVLLTHALRWRIQLHIKLHWPVADSVIYLQISVYNKKMSPPNAIYIEAHFTNHLWACLQVVPLVTLISKQCDIFRFQPR